MVSTWVLKVNFDGEDGLDEEPQHCVDSADVSHDGSIDCWIFSEAVLYLTDIEQTTVGVGSFHAAQLRASSRTVVEFEAQELKQMK